MKLAGLPLDESVVDNRLRQLVAEALIALMRREYPREAADEAAVKLAAAGVPEARFEAEVLVRHVTGLSRAQFVRQQGVEFG